jgi:predicted transcriptional regulator
MDISKLTATGLTPLQAQAYALLFEKGTVSPPQLAQHLKLSRTNAYKLLDKLVSLQLAIKQESGKKLVYSPSNPLALANVTAQFRAEATAREEAASSIMQDLLTQYYEHSEKPSVSSASGQKAVADLYRKQLKLREDVHFIHTPVDVSRMGFDTMHDIRITPGRHGNQRHGILSEPEKGPINYAAHKRSNLEISWIKKDAYTAPVEWSVTQSSLLIVSFVNEPHAVLIVDPVIAGAFLQLWKLLSSFVRQEKTHQELAQGNK